MPRKPKEPGKITVPRHATPTRASVDAHISALARAAEQLTPSQVSKLRVLLPPGPRYLSIAKAAAYCDVSTRTIYRWIAEGCITAYRAGPTLLRIEVSELEQLMKPVAAVPGATTQRALLLVADQDQ